MVSDDTEWYPVGWSPGDEPYAPGGVRVSIAGGPLHGRTAHMVDRETCLWVAESRRAGLIVTDSREPPELPPGARLLGRYAFDANSECLSWRVGID